MIGPAPHTDAPSAAASRLDAIIEYLMIALVVCVPLAGAHEMWGQVALLALAGAMAFCLSVKLAVRPTPRFVWSWAYLPVGLFLALLVLQLAPLPAGLAGVLSSDALAARTKLLGDLPDAANALKRVTLSLYPLATRHDLRLTLAAAAVFVVVVNVHRRPEQIKRLLGAMAAVGVLATVTALAQGHFYHKASWIMSVGRNSAWTDGIISHIRYTEYTNVSMGAALGLLLVKLREGVAGRKLTLQALMAQLRKPRMPAVWCLAGILLIGAVTVLLSPRRGGAVALFLAGAFAAVMLALKAGLKRRRWIVALLALGALAWALHAGFDAARGRLASAQSVDGGQVINDPRVWIGTLPVIGTGSGTHGVVRRVLGGATIPQLPDQAWNRYVQMAEATGLVGLGLGLGFLGIVWWCYARVVRGARLPIHWAAFGIGFALLAIMVHGLGNSGRRVLGSECLAAVLAGILVSMARGLARKHERPERPARAFFFRPLRFAAPCCVVALGLWSLLPATRACLAQAHWKQALSIAYRLRQGDWLGSDEDYGPLESHAAAAARLEPGNVEYRYFLNFCRWRRLCRVRDGRIAELADVPHVVAGTPAIVKDLHRTRRLCPGFGRTYSALGMLQRFVLGEPRGADHIRTGLALAPGDAIACFAAGLLDAMEGRVDDSLPKFRRSLRLESRLLRDVVEVYVRQVNRPDMALAVARGDIGRLLHVANVLRQEPEHHDLADEACREAVALLKVKCRQPNAPAWAFASLAKECLRSRDYEAAIEYFRRALALQYGQVHWRLRLAKALAATGQVPQAMHEARVCLRFQPGMRAARRLIEDMSVLAAAAAAE